MKELLLATTNAGKVQEIQAILKDSDWEIYSLADFPSLEHPKEDGETFKENALQKAVFIAEKSEMLTLADDSGLVVDALDGAPGVYSARYAGENQNDQANLEKLLREMEGFPQENRKAHFACAMAICFPEDFRFFVAEDTCEGVIAEKPLGDNGFGYDPVFYIPELGKTMAQLTDAEKNQISHRGKALRRLEEMLPEIIDAMEQYQTMLRPCF